MVCHNLVSTNRHVISTSPSLVSSIMQYFGPQRYGSGAAGLLRAGGYRSSTVAGGAMQAGGTGGSGGSAENFDSPQNFATLGTAAASWRFVCYAVL